MEWLTGGLLASVRLTLIDWVLAGSGVDIAGLRVGDVDDAAAALIDDADAGVVRRRYIRCRWGR